VTVRFWAGARAAAGVAELDVDVPAEGASVAALREQVVRRFADRPRLAEVLAVCSTLVGDQPVGRADPGSVLVAPGQTVEFLPPFAGG
jgi:molybdopterin converting factor small subunit